jgi:hypothetical protein
VIAHFFVEFLSNQTHQKFYYACFKYKNEKFEQFDDAFGVISLSQKIVI